MAVRELRRSADRLYEVLLLPWMQSTKFRVICEATRHLADALTKYADYLDSSTARVNVLHSQMETARSPGRNILHECVVTDWHLAMPALEAPLRVWNQARQCLHDRERNCLQYRGFCISVDVQCGDYHLCGLYLLSLSLSLSLSV